MWCLKTSLWLASLGKINPTMKNSMRRKWTSLIWKPTYWQARFEKKNGKKRKMREKKWVLPRMVYLVSRFCFYVSQVFHKLWCSLIMFHLQNYSLQPQTLFELIFLFLKTFWGYLWNYFQVWSQSWLSSICYQIGLVLQIQATEIIFPIECCN